MGSGVMNKLQKLLGIDPEEGYYCIVKDLEIRSEGNSIPVRPINGISIDGVTYFCTDDPQYELDLEDKTISELEIQCNVSRLSLEDIRLLLNKIENRIDDPRNEPKGISESTETIADEPSPSRVRRRISLFRKNRTDR